MSVEEYMAAMRALSIDRGMLEDHQHFPDNLPRPAITHEPRDFKSKSARAENAKRRSAYLRHDSHKRVYPTKWEFKKNC